MKYSVDGNLTTAIATEATTSGFVNLPLIGKGITAGRVFYLRGMFVYNTGTNAAVYLQDAASGATLVTTANKYTVPVETNKTTHVDFPAPGLKFKTGVMIQAGASAASLAIAVGNAGGWGYEEA